MGAIAGCEELVRHLLNWMMLYSGSETCVCGWGEEKVRRVCGMKPQVGRSTE